MVAILIYIGLLAYTNTRLPFWYIYIRVNNLKKKKKNTVLSRSQKNLYIFVSAAVI